MTRVISLLLMFIVSVSFAAQSALASDDIKLVIMHDDMTGSAYQIKEINIKGLGFSSNGSAMVMYLDAHINSSLGLDARVILNISTTFEITNVVVAFIVFVTVLAALIMWVYYRRPTLEVDN